MAKIDTDRNLLFGLLALQNGLIDQVKLVAAFQAWTLDKGRPLADHLVVRGDLDADDRSAVLALVARHLKKHGDSIENSLAAIPAGPSTRQSLLSIADHDIGASLTILGPQTDGEDKPARNFERTAAFAGVTLAETDPGPEPALAASGQEAFNGFAGRYQILGEIARGGMGSVLRGRDPHLGRDLALKVLLDQHRDRSDLVDRFVEEAQICGQLQHPGVVPVYELGKLADQRPYFTMKLVKGQTLAALLAERTSPADNLPRFFSIFEAVCQTMAYAHARAVIHRDLKPSNVMVGSFGEVQVMDWGLAKVLPKAGPKTDVVPPPVNETIVATLRSTGDSDLSQAGSVLGTPAYMAPEQARGEVEAIDRRADVFALGSILCEILTGAPAFAGGSAIEIVKAAGRADTAAALARLEQCGADGELVALARESLEPLARDRPADAGVVAARMTAYLAGVQERLREVELSRAAESARAVEAEAKASVERRARRLTAALAATVLLAGLLGGAGWRWVELQRVERVREASGRVNVALQEATRLRGLAQGAAIGDLAPWALAASAAERARDLLDPGVEPALQTQVLELAAELAAERLQAEAAAQAAARDRHLLDRLVAIRSGDRAESAAAYADAFREAGLDLTELHAEEAGKQIRGRAPAVAMAVAAALDDWASIRSGKPGAALSAVARVADPDPWRNGLREALNHPDKAARLASLHDLARSAPYETLGPVSLNLLGGALMAAGDAAGAEGVLRRAQHRHPGDVWINFDLAGSLERLARRDEAIRYYTAARSLRPETAHDLAHALEDRGEKEEAIGVFKDLRRLQPENGWHLGCLAGALRDQGRSQEADVILEAAATATREAIRRRPDDAYAHFSLGAVLRKQGKVDEAIAEYRTAIRLQPEDAAYHDNLSELLGRQGKLDEAIAEHRTAIRIRPDFANAYNTLGYLLSEVKDDKRAAAAAYREAIRLQPDFARAHNNLGRALQHLGELDEALAEYRTSCVLEPDSVEFLENLGEVLELQRKRDEAIVVYRTAIRVRPDAANLHNDLAWVLVKVPDCTAQERGESLEHARQAVALSPEAGGFQNTLGLAEYRAGHWAESIAAVERSIALTTGVEVTNWFFLAMALWQQGDKDRSRSFFEQAVSWTKANHPVHADVPTIWREAAELLGQPGPEVPPADLPMNPFAP